MSNCTVGEVLWGHEDILLRTVMSWETVLELESEKHRLTGTREGEISWGVCLRYREKSELS